MARKKSILKLKDMWRVQADYRDASIFDLRFEGQNTAGTQSEVTMSLNYWQIENIAQQLWKVFNEKQQSEARHNKSIRESLTNMKVA